MKDFGIWLPKFLLAVISVAATVLFVGVFGFVGIAAYRCIEQPETCQLRCVPPSLAALNV